MKVHWLLAIVLVLSACSGTSTQTSGGASPDLAAWCDLWNGPPISDDAAEGGVEGAMQAILARSQAAVDVAPEEIRDSSQLMLDADTLFVEAMEEAGWDDAALTPEQLATFEKPEFAQAMDRLNEFSDAEC